MRRTRKLPALIAALALAGSLAVTPLAQAGSFSSDHKCSPGQHGNGHPGFKPGSC